MAAPEDESAPSVDPSKKTGLEAARDVFSRTPEPVTARMSKSVMGPQGPRHPGGVLRSPFPAPRPDLGGPAPLGARPPGLVRKAISARLSGRADLAHVTILPTLIRVKRFSDPRVKRFSSCHPFPTVFCSSCREAEEKMALSGPRGSVVGFSKKAKRRMMDRLDELDWKVIARPGSKADAKHWRQARGLFVTLTYDGFGPDWKIWKEDFRRFWQMAQRRWGSDISCVWKLESQNRRAVRMCVKFVPHFHLSLDLKREVPVKEFREWLSDAWGRVAGGGSEKHFRSGTSCEPMYDSGDGKLRGYLAKYLAKVQDSDAETGRIWGERGSMVEASRQERICSWSKLLRRVRKIRPGNDYYREFGKRTVVRGETRDGRALNIVPTVLRFDSLQPDEILRGLIRPLDVPLTPKSNCNDNYSSLDNYESGSEESSLFDIGGFRAPLGAKGRKDRKTFRELPGIKWVRSFPGLGSSAGGGGGEDLPEPGAGSGGSAPEVLASDGDGPGTAPGPDSVS